MEYEICKTNDMGFGSYYVIKNDLIGDYLLKYGLWELHIMRISEMFLKSDDVVLDIGANIGFHTVQFARRVQKVYSFEPQNSIYDLLVSNIVSNGLSNKVKSFRFGLYNKKTKVNMQPIEDCTDETGQLNFGGIGITDKKINGEKIDLEVWDKYFSDVKKVDMIKIDVQGSEFFVLKGMENMIKSCKPWILIENGDDDNGKRTLDLLKDLGYTIYRPMEKIPLEDCICLHEENSNHNEITKFIRYISILPVEYSIV